MNAKLIIYNNAVLSYKDILSYFLNIPNSKLLIKLGFFGKPYLLNTLVNFNVSYKHDIGVILISNYLKVGIDIEYKNLNLKGISKILSDNEIILYNTLDTKTKNIFVSKIFCIKESILKAIGIGITEQLSLIDVSRYNDINRFTFICKLNKQKYKLSIIILDLGNYWLVLTFY